MSKLEGKTALVTGAARGIGFAIAQRLAAAGASVTMLDRDDAVKEASGKVPGSKAITADLADIAVVTGLANDIRGGKYSFDILVNNAGVHPKKPNGESFPFEEIDLDHWNRVVMINLTAPILIAQAVLPGMKKNGWGRVINIVSRAARTFVPSTGVQYGATKAGLLGATRVIAAEYSAFGITANSVAPGRIDTPLSNQSNEAVLAESKKKIPAGRFGQPDELAAAVEFLATPDASYITGTTLDVNGGAFMT